ncbi:hypothetical protein GCM10027053_47640 [Intrasporangium mesophilum]
MTAKSELWDVALEQDGLVTADDARELGLDPRVLRQLAHRGSLEHAATGVYRFTRYPYQQNTPYREAVLWTGHRPTYLSHETVLEVHNLCDVNPSAIHVTVPVGVRVRRNDPRFQLHADRLLPEDVGWWEEIPAVLPAMAIRQCIEDGLPTYLVRQAITTARRRRLITDRHAKDLDRQLKDRGD